MAVNKAVDVFPPQGEIKSPAEISAKPYYSEICTGKQYATGYVFVFINEDMLVANGFGEILCWPGSPSKDGGKGGCFRSFLPLSF